jgi:release factor glutamine methyltransferase
MIVSEWLSAAAQTLNAAGVTTARLDSLVLLEDCLQKERSHLLAHPETKLTNAQEKTLTTQLERRAQHEPLAYIRGTTEFYGRDFIIDHRVLEPRPESETIIELLKGLKLPVKPQIVDVGTGSGMLAITAKLELPQAVVTAVDIDPNCLAVGVQNAQKHQLDITFLEQDLYDGPADILLCNLPYVPDNFQINQAAMHEPRLAIFGGSDGLDLYRKLFSQLKHKPTYILTESLPPQHETLAAIATEYGYTLAKTDDFIQLFTRST